MEAKNYDEFDYQTIVIKKEKVDEVIKRYECLGWKKTQISKNSQNSSLVEVEFSRKHFVENKDDLQLLQIYIESDLNQIGKLERYRHAKTTAIGLVFGLLLAGFLAAGISIFCLLANVFSWIGASVLLFAALAVLILELIYLPKLYKKEKEVFCEKVEKCKAELDFACSRAKILTGEKVGNDKKDC